MKQLPHWKNALLLSQPQPNSVMRPRACKQVLYLGCAVFLFPLMFQIMLKQVVVSPIQPSTAKKERE